MAEEYKAGYPLAPANDYSKSDQEAGRFDSNELRNQKRKKLALYIVAFVIFQTGVITLMTMTVMKFRTPKFQMRSSNSFDTFDVVTTSNPSFNLQLNAQLGVKNTNFGPYKFDNTTIFFYYRGVEIGSAAIPKSKANFRSTKKLNIVANLVAPTNLVSNSELTSDIGSGILPLTSQARLNGKVTIMFMFKKKKSANLNCTMEVNISTKALQNVQCK